MTNKPYLHLEHVMTDRGGREVYNIHQLHHLLDCGSRGIVLGQIRIPPRGSTLQPIVDWAKEEDDE